MNIGSYSFEEYLQLVKFIHGHIAPGVLIGGYMVELAKSRIPAGVLFDAISETESCLPDAIQLLTPCSVGNGWLRVFNLGRYALSLYDKYQGQGWRVFIDPARLDAWPEFKIWFLKLKPKREQDSELLRAQIREAGPQLCGLQPIKVKPQFLGRHSKGRIIICPLCGEPYPAADGSICRACQGEAPYVRDEVQDREKPPALPRLETVPVEQAIGRKVLHDMTLIIPGESKGPAMKHGQLITVGDLCRMHQMGRQHVYLDTEEISSRDWVHEDEAARAFARAMAGEGVTFEETPREGKINLLAERHGLLWVDVTRLEQFNFAPQVMCASRQSYSVVSQQQILAGTRAIPLFLPRADFQRAMAVLQDGPLFRVLTMRSAKVGILITGTEVFRGLVEDKFEPIIRAKVEKLGSKVVHSLIVPDQRRAISQGVEELLHNQVDLLVTTAGLSVDPDDLTRQGLIDAGATDLVYGAPILPGAMTMVARLGPVPIIGVPACALYYKHTSLDLLLPRLLAGLPITRADLAPMGHGALCWECPTCTFPKCPFGR